MDEFIEIYGLAYGCPKKERSDGCPFRELDRLSFSERVDLIENMTAKEKTMFLFRHKECTCLNGSKKKNED